MAENDPYRLPGDVNPYAPPEAELAPLIRAYPPAGYASGLEPFSIDATLRRAWSVYQQRLVRVMAFVLGSFGIFMGYYILGFVVIIPGIEAGADARVAGAVNAVFMLSVYAVQYWLQLGMTMGLLKLARGQDVEFAELFRGGRFFLRFLGAALLYVLALVPVFIVCAVPAGVAIALTRGEPSGLAIVAIIASIILWVVGVMFVSVRLYLFPYVLVDRDCGAIDSIRASFEITRGHVVELLAVALLSGLIGISGVLACGVGLLFTYPLGMLILSAAYALLAGGGLASLGPKMRSDLEFLDFES